MRILLIEIAIANWATVFRNEGHISNALMTTLRPMPILKKGKDAPNSRFTEANS
jgi:hypothetical protein